MQEIVFFDTEIDSKSGRILDIGAIKNIGSLLHTAKHSEFAAFIRDSSYTFFFGSFYKNPPTMISKMQT